MSRRVDLGPGEISVVVRIAGGRGLQQRLALRGLRKVVGYERSRLQKVLL